MRRLLSLALPLGLAGCPETAPEPFDPTGRDSELYGEWDVNGLAPTDAICARAGIDTVELEFESADGSETFSSPAFRFPCGPGYFDSVGPVLRAGTYGYRWRALSGTEVVRESVRYGAVVVAGEELELQPVDFLRRLPVRVDVALAWATGTGDGTCVDALVDTMSWELRRDTALGPLIADSSGSVACADAFAIPDLPTGVLEAGGYVLVVHGAAGDGATWDAECAVTVFESGPSAASCAVPASP